MRHIVIFNVYNITVKASLTLRRLAGQVACFGTISDMNLVRFARIVLFKVFSFQTDLKEHHVPFLDKAGLTYPYPTYTCSLLPNTAFGLVTMLCLDKYLNMSYNWLNCTVITVIY